jgi:transcriptional regulator with XRE-family HTH domain
MNVGTVIRNYRQRLGLSQGDLEKRTGLMRCYISRVENGHTVPSIETLSRIARALDAQLADMFAGLEAVGSADPTEQQFLEEMRRYLPVLSPAERERVLEMVRQMAAHA